MFDKKEFEQVLRDNRYTNPELARIIGINPATLWRKINGISDFYRRDIERIKAALKLSAEQVDRIFFAEEQPEKTRVKIQAKKMSARAALLPYDRKRSHR